MKALKMLLGFVALVGGMLTAMVLGTWLILLAHEEHVASNGQRFGWLFEKCDPPCRRHAKPEAEKHE